MSWGRGRHSFWLQGTAPTFLSNKFCNPVIGSYRFVPVRLNAVYKRIKAKQEKQRH